MWFCIHSIQLKCVFVYICHVLLPCKLQQSKEYIHRFVQCTRAFMQSVAWNELFQLNISQSVWILANDHNGMCVWLLKPLMSVVKSVWELLGVLELCVSLIPLLGTSWRCSSQTETDPECWDGSPHMDRLPPLTYPEQKKKKERHFNRYTKTHLRTSSKGISERVFTHTLLTRSENSNIYKYEVEKVETSSMQMSRFTNIGEFWIVQSIEVLQLLNRIEQNRI